MNMIIDLTMHTMHTCLKIKRRIDIGKGTAQWTCLQRVHFTALAFGAGASDRAVRTCAGSVSSAGKQIASH